MQYSLTSFVLDISPTMGSKRKVVEEVNTFSYADQSNHASTRERETTDLQWVNEFVAKKIQTYVGLILRWSHGIS